MQTFVKHSALLIIVVFVTGILTSCGGIPAQLSGFYYAKIGEHKNAVYEFTIAISEAHNDPECASIYCERAYEYIQLGRYQKAIDDYDKSVALNSKIVKLFGLDGPYIYGWRGYAYEKLGQYDKAIDDYNVWIKRDRKYAPPYQMRGNAYIQIGQYQKAVDDCTTAINLDPKFAIAYACRATAYEQQKKQDLAKNDREMAQKLGCKPR